MRVVLDTKIKHPQSRKIQEGWSPARELLEKTIFGDHILDAHLYEESVPRHTYASGNDLADLARSTDGRNQKQEGDQEECKRLDSTYSKCATPLLHFLETHETRNRPLLPIRTALVPPSGYFLNFNP